MARCNPGGILHPGITLAYRVIAQVEELVQVIPVEFLLSLHVEVPPRGSG